MKTHVKLLLAALVAVAPTACKTPTATRQATPKTPPASQPTPVKLQLYTMSMCPFSSEVEESLKAIVDSLGAEVMLRVDYIVDEKDGQLVTLRGQPEIAGNTIELCAMAVARDTRRLMEFITCQNDDREVIPSRWEQCAARAGIDRKQIQRCFGGKQGAELLVASMQRTRAAGVRRSPTLLIDDKAHAGPRDLHGLLRSICASLSKQHGGVLSASVCAAVPPEVEVKVVMIDDARCKECTTMLSAVEGNLRNMFGKLQIKRIDYSTAGAKALYERLKLRGLPALLFERSVEKSSRYPKIERWIETVGDYRRLMLPDHFDPQAEICDNQKDDTGNGQIDCADPTCQHTMTCRKESAGHLEVFTMAHCPFCHQAVGTLKELFRLVGRRNVKLDIHYVAEAAADGGFRSLHGQSEIDENIRQLCARKHFARGDRYLKYIWCRDTDHSDKWQPCAKKSGLRIAVMQKCISGGEGERLLTEDIAIARALHIEGTPTWIANRRHFFRGVTIDDILDNFCEHNQKLQGCQKRKKEAVTLPSPTKN